MRRERRLAFGEVADLYDRARPSYPPALIDDVIEISGIAPGECLLEVGAGTGIATRAFAERGLGVLAIEPDGCMAALARRNCAAYDAVTFEQAEFESWPGDRVSFPLVVSAQAWHWIAPQLRYVKAREALRDGGTLAAFWTHPEWERCSLREQLQAAYRGAGVPPGLGDPMHPATTTAGRFADWDCDIEAAAGLRCPATRAYRWTRDYSSEQYVALLGTHSDHIVLEDATRVDLLDGVAAAIDRAGGAMTMSFVSRLCVARAC